MNAKQFAWAYLLKHGKFNVERSYYGGNTWVDDAKSYLDILRINEHEWVDGKKIVAMRQLCYENIRYFGVNWGKTYTPKNDNVSIFNGTFADSGSEKILCGTLILNNGDKISVIAEDLDFGNVFELLASHDDLKKTYESFFGSVDN